MKRFIYSILSGLLFAFSWPTYGFPFLLFLAFVPLLLLEHEIVVKKEKRSYGKVFGYSYISFFIWNYGATQWLHYSQNPDGSLSWMAFLFPVFINSLLMSLVFILFHFVKKRAGTWYGIFFFPIIWVCFEKFHLSWEMSWPWLNLGNAFAEYPQIIQWYEVTGTFGGTLWIIIINLIIFYHIRAFQVTREKIYIWKPVYYSILVIGVPVALSLVMYRTYQEKSEQSLEVVLAQPDLDPYTEKYTQSGETVLSGILSSVDSTITNKTKFIVAPETAFPGRGFVYVNNFQNDPYIDSIRRWMKMKHSQISFVSGVSLAEAYSGQETPTARYTGDRNVWVDLYNSAIQLDLPGTIQHYNKSKLVVGVEHFPYSSILKPLIGDYMLNFGGTMESLGTQNHPTVFTNKKNKAKIAPVICYESIYGEYVGEYVKSGANVLFIMTNDSWWSDSQGHKQLLAYARLRAIETRRDIARSANSGISAFINQKGDIIEQLPYGYRGALKGEINLNSELTFYSKYGDVIARISLIAAGIIIAYVLSKIIIVWLKPRKTKTSQINFKNKK
ncbi:apolipoprotein N-acyltransferase [Apibacter raozihei]|uniref:apolipoprotein N-acyltransferase n=1 Tax=Apibacter raozihei TaxID=2500547 RepID=UPI000FE2D650|nr:apolipoprotein N-acyltransferase [Apibacter raozihei]